MNLHAPSQVLFSVSLIIAVLALIGRFAWLPYISLYGFWVAIIAYLVLAFAVLKKS
jgi:hypothetical protein